MKRARGKGETWDGGGEGRERERERENKGGQATMKLGTKAEQVVELGE
jgi:hypothetical protein